MASKKKNDVEELQRIRSGLDEINGVHQGNIILQLDASILALKNYILVKQRKLEKEIAKLSEMTNDKIACGLLDSVCIQFSKIGDRYAEILKIEGQKPDTVPEQISLMTAIISMLSQLIEDLQEVEDFLNIDV